MSTRRTSSPLLLLFLSVAAMVGALLVQPAPVRADEMFTIKGLGYGHGVGMSQWGAWAGAREGATFEEILAHYYPGTSIQTPIENIEITVKLSSVPWASVSTITQDYTKVVLSPVGSALTLVKTPLAGAVQTEAIPVGGWVSCVYGDGGVRIITSTTGGYEGPFKNVEAQPADGDRVRVSLWTSSATEIAAREYWGKIRVQNSSSATKVNTFNIVRMESYLRSIGEVPGDWAQPSSSYYALEAVKAQAVAARSYAMTHKDPYLDDNQYDQVYYGYTGPPGYSKPFELRSPGIPLAAEQTAGKVVRYNGNIISTYFSSHSGGYTTDTRVWGNSNPSAYPYLVAQPDPWSLAAPPNNLGYSWSFTMSAADLTSKLSGLVNVGTITKVAVESRDTNSTSSHVRTFRITGTNGTAVLSADKFRGRLGWGTMRSTLVTSINGVGAPRTGDPAPEMWVSQRWVTDSAPDSTATGTTALTPTLFDTTTTNQYLGGGVTPIAVYSAPTIGASVVAYLDPGAEVSVYAWRHAENVLGDKRWYRVDKPVARHFRGKDRYETAILVSREAYPDTAPAVVVAKGDDFPDALAAAPLARAYGGPVILTPSAGLTTAVKAELQRLDPAKVFFVGLSSKVLSEVKGALPHVLEDDFVRLVGANRYETATLIAQELKKKSGSAQMVAMVPGDNFPDALSVAPLAANKGWAILLTPQAGPLPAVTSSAFKTLGATSALVVGTKVAPPSGVTAISKVGVDRYQTSVMVAEYGKSLGLNYKHTGFVTGENYPDGLVAGPWLGKDGSALLVTRPTAVPSHLKTLLAGATTDLMWMDFVGLPDSAASAVMNMVR
jgi:SpoIID/LytB domain protein